MAETHCWLSVLIGRASSDNMIAFLDLVVASNNSRYCSGLPTRFVVRPYWLKALHSSMGRREAIGFDDGAEELAIARPVVDPAGRIAGGNTTTVIGQNLTY